MPGQGRLGDKAQGAADAHGCPGCPHPVTGPAVSGSANVRINGRPALRVDDTGIHAACCGPNTWQAVSGAATVFINGKAAHRSGDLVRHCGGVGQLAEGSGDVIVGDGAPLGGERAGLRKKKPSEERADLWVYVRRESGRKRVLVKRATVRLRRGDKKVRGPEAARKKLPAKFLNLQTGTYQISATTTVKFKGKKKPRRYRATKDVSLQVKPKPKKTTLVFRGEKPGLMIFVEGEQGPIKEAKVRVQGLAIEKTTNGEGNAFFGPKELSPGSSYTLDISHDEHQSKSVPVTMSRSRASQDVSLVPHSLVVTVIAPVAENDPGAVNGATVKVDGQRDRTTDARGEVTFKPIRGGTYNVTASKAHRAFSQQTATVDGVKVDGPSKATVTLVRRALALTAMPEKTSFEVGEKISPSVGIKDLPSVTPEGVKWTGLTSGTDIIGGYSGIDIIGGYTDRSGDYTVTVTPANLSGTSAAFYWIQDGSKTLKVSGSLEGEPLHEATMTWTITRPQVSQGALASSFNSANNPDGLGGWWGTISLGVSNVGGTIGLLCLAPDGHHVPAARSNIIQHPSAGVPLHRISTNTGRSDGTAKCTLHLLYKKDIWISIAHFDMEWSWQGQMAQDGVWDYKADPVIRNPSTELALPTWSKYQFGL